FATSWNPDADGTVDALTVAGAVVYAGGVFGSIGGQPRLRLAALDASTGAATAWNPAVRQGSVQALAVAGSTVYVGGAFAGVGGATRANIGAVDVTSGAATAWNPGADAMVRTLAV